MLRINEHIPDIEVEAFQNDKTIKFKFSDYKGKWLVLLFYPADFTFICPTELGDAAQHYNEFKKLDAEVMSVSTDTVFVHKAWHDNSEIIKKIKFPMIADPTRQVCREFGTFIDKEGLSQRATFIVDPDGCLVAYEMHSNNIGRNILETLRKLQAAIFVKKNKGLVCPANWSPGKSTLKPGLDLVGKI